MSQKRIPDHQLLIDLFQASAPEADEHRLAFTIRFSPKESARIKKVGSVCYSEALRTVKYILKGNSPISPAIDVVLTLERNRKPYASMKKNIYGLHAHGWIRSTKGFTADDLDERINSLTRSKKIANTRASSSKDHNPLWNFEYEDPYRFEDDYKAVYKGQSAFVFDPELHPVDSAWVAYIVKEFDENPKWRADVQRKFAATKHTKAKAKKIRQRRSKIMDVLVRASFEDTIANWRDMRSLR